MRGGERFFARGEVRQAVGALRAAADAGPAPDGPAPDGPHPTARHRTGDAPDAAGTPGLVPQVRQVLGQVGLTDEPPPPGALRDRWDSLLALVGVAEELVAADPSTSLLDLVRELDQRTKEQHAPSALGVTLASLHAAKGLEWDAVFLVGLTDGTLPIQHAETPEDIEEERRLFYVGVTRARSRLALSWALSRTEGGKRTRRRSRFLTGLAPDSARPDHTGRAPGRCRVCGSALLTTAQIKAGRCASCPSNADPDLVQALRAWRKDRSAQASVPAFVVFSDATLLAIADHKRKPADNAALLAIPGYRPGETGRLRVGRTGDRRPGRHARLLRTFCEIRLRRHIGPTYCRCGWCARAAARTARNRTGRPKHALRQRGARTPRRCRMTDTRMISGGFGLGVTPSWRIEGPAIMPARPRRDQVAVVGADTRRRFGASTA